MALRNEEKVAGKIKCQREPDFQALYAVLGDKGEQDRIRAANDGERHCAFLAACSSACDALPKDAGEQHTGKPCPNNPYESERDLFSALDDQFALLRHAHYIGDLVELGILAGPDEITPEDFTVATIMRRQAKAQELQAMSMGAVGGMFGGRE